MDARAKQCMPHKQTNLLGTWKLLRQEHEISYKILFQRLETSDILQLGEILVYILNETEVKVIITLPFRSTVTDKKKKRFYD